MDKDTEKLVDMCRIFIGDKATAEDTEILSAIEKCSALYPAADKIKAKELLMEMYSMPIGGYKILSDKLNPGAKWLSQNDYEEKGKISWDFWNRYSKYLRDNEHYPSGVIFEINKTTDDILDNLFNPQIKDLKISKKGLVVGQVQSGKTSNFTGLICKAVDAGFNVIIVFAGVLNDLRSQTQNRLETNFLGFTTKDLKLINKEKETIGVGRINKKPIAHAATTITTDFQVKTVNSIGLNFNTKEPILFVIKKNKNILENLIKWLNGKDRSQKSVLFIDDEADNASVNAARTGNTPTAINSKIKELLEMFIRNAYVGYTATPYANIFIDPKKEDDLFPRHFIVSLPTPENYVGPGKVFGIEKSDEEVLPLVNIVKDYQGYVPDRHKLEDYVNAKYSNLPETLKYAIRCFILSCAVRIARGQEKKHNSMLIHVSRYKKWQNEIHKHIQKYFKYIKGNVLADDAYTLDMLRRDYEMSFTINSEPKHKFLSYVETTQKVLASSYSVLKNNVTECSWEDIQECIYKAVDKIDVKALNGSSSDALTYEEHKNEGYYVIAIGGDKLSRGLTLEGLTISYFLRSSKMYDTLMQMGRWFGYRPGYVDLCRLFISPELYKWYKEITKADTELREEFDYLWETKGSPQNYALKVRTSPGLLVTSPLKMQESKDVQISWASTLVETYTLIRERAVKEDNFKTTDKFLSKLGSPVVIEDHHNILWKDVEPSLVCKYIRAMKLGKSNRIKMNFELMVQYIEKCYHDFGELDKWRVAVRNLNGNVEQDSYFQFAATGSMPIFTSERSIKGSEGEDIYDLRNYRLIAGPKDEFIDYDEMNYDLSEWTKYTKSKRENWSKDYPSPVIVRKELRSPHTPLLLIYPLSPTGANKPEYEEVFKVNEYPFIGFAIVFPNSQNSNGVKYKINKIEEYSQAEEEFEQSNDNIYDEDEK